MCAWNTVVLSDPRREDLDRARAFREPDVGDRLDGRPGGRLALARVRGGWRGLREQLFPGLFLDYLFPDAAVRGGRPCFGVVE